VAIGNAIFVRDRKSLPKNGRSMRLFAFKPARMELLEWLASHRLNRISKNTGG
jgi:hypothetical protein